MLLLVLLPKLLELLLVCLRYAFVLDYDVILVIPYRCAVGVVEAAGIDNHARLRMRVRQS